MFRNQKSNGVPSQPHLRSVQTNFMGHTVVANLTPGLAFARVHNDVVREGTVEATV